MRHKLIHETHRKRICQNWGKSPGQFLENCWKNKTLYAENKLRLKLSSNQQTDKILVLPRKRFFNIKVPHQMAKWVNIRALFRYVINNSHYNQVEIITSSSYWLYGTSPWAEFNSLPIFPSEITYYKHELSGLGGHLQSENRPPETPQNPIQNIYGRFLHQKCSSKDQYL